MQEGSRGRLILGIVAVVGKNAWVWSLSGFGVDVLSTEVVDNKGRIKFQSGS